MIRVVKIKESIKFGNYEKAFKFAQRVNGKVNDLSNDPKAKSRYSVTFEQAENDFHYPNDFWQ